MRIAIWHNLPSGGAKRALYDQVKGLIARGHVVEAWCPSISDQSFCPLQELIPVHVLPMAMQPPGKFSPHVPWGGYRNLTRQLNAMDAHCQQCARQIDDDRFDVLLAHGCQSLGVSSIARYVRFLPAVIYLQEPHRVLYEALPSPPWLAPPANGSAWWAPRQAWRALFDLLGTQARRVQVREEVSNAAAFDLILVNSRFSRESVLRAYGLDAQVCYLGIDTDRFRPLCRPKEHYLIGVGAIRPHKNIEFIIEAVARVSEPRPRLVWIGNTTSHHYLDQLLRLACSVDVDFEPRIAVSDDELVDTLNRATAMVYAPRLEPFGYAPVEAQGCGLPVIAVAEGGVRETVTHGINGMLVEHDVSEFAEAIEQIVTNPRLAEALGQNGRQIVLEKWSLDAAADRFEQHIARTTQSQLAWNARA